MEDRNAAKPLEGACSLESSKSPPADPLDSGLRRKFLLYCEENPGAEECRVYDV
jgi:hypothetical protein